MFGPRIAPALVHRSCSRVSSSSPSRIVVLATIRSPLHLTLIKVRSAFCDSAKRMRMHRIGRRRWRFGLRLIELGGGKAYKRPKRIAFIRDAVRMAERASSGRFVAGVRRRCVVLRPALAPRAAFRSLSRRPRAPSRACTRQRPPRRARAARRARPAVPLAVPAPRLCPAVLAPSPRTPALPPRVPPRAALAPGSSPRRLAPSAAPPPNARAAPRSSPCVCPDRSAPRTCLAGALRIRPDQQQFSISRKKFS